MKTIIRHDVAIHRTGRVLQLEGLFELPPSERSETTITVDLPIEERDWSIGLIVGPSGSGKTTIARTLFGEALVAPWKWPRDRSIVDAFPSALGIKDITALLSSVGFSSPPAWLRPFHVLSNGEQFRVAIAFALAEARPLTVIDEFTSVVDRTVAQIGSAAVARAVRARAQRFIAVSCHYDIVDWLQPDWLYEASTNSFAWRSLQRRPPLTLTVRRVDPESWRIFKHHHYLDTTLNRGAKCFLAQLDERPVAFTAVLPFPHARRPGWREHRTVCLPDFQGVGIGNAMSDYVASLFKATGRPYYSTTSSPTMVAARARSPLWRMHRAASRTADVGSTSSSQVNRAGAQARLTTGFEYVGPARLGDARRHGVPV
jgi:hypothetical protein